MMHVKINNIIEERAHVYETPQNLLDQTGRYDDFL
jgi:hypothetical protein